MLDDDETRKQEQAIPQNEQSLRGPGPTGRRAQPGQRDEDDTAGARIYPETPPGETFPSDPPTG